MISAQIERVEGTAIDGAYIFVLYFLPASLEIVGNLGMHRKVNDP